MEMNSEMTQAKRNQSPMKNTFLKSLAEPWIDKVERTKNAKAWALLGKTPQISAEQSVRLNQSKDR